MKYTENGIQYHIGLKQGGLLCTAVCPAAAASIPPETTGGLIT